MSAHHQTQNGHKKPSKHQKPSLVKRHSAKSVPKTKNVQIKDDRDNGDDDGLMQYCATCEKQIVTPSNSTLYCSERSVIVDLNVVCNQI